MTIDSIMMFDYKGNNEDHPLLLFMRCLDDWRKMPIAVFTGARYNLWNGPDPEKTDVYALDTPVSHIRYIVINSWGHFPSGAGILRRLYSAKACTPPRKKAGSSS